MTTCAICQGERHDNLDVWFKRDGAGRRLVVCLCRACVGAIIHHVADATPTLRLCRYCGETEGDFTSDLTGRMLCGRCDRRLREETRKGLGLPADDTPRICHTCAHQRPRPQEGGFWQPYCAATLPVPGVPGVPGGWPDAPDGYGCDDRWVPRPTKEKP